MAHFAPGSQSRALMAEKELIAERLLAQGLTVTQIALQIRSSPHFVRQVRSKRDVSNRMLDNVEERATG